MPVPSPFGIWDYYGERFEVENKIVTSSVLCSQFIFRSWGSVKPLGHSGSLVTSGSDVGRTDSSSCWGLWNRRSKTIRSHPQAQGQPLHVNFRAWDDALQKGKSDQLRGSTTRETIRGEIPTLYTFCNFCILLRCLSGMAVTAAFGSCSASFAKMGSMGLA